MMSKMAGAVPWSVSWSPALLMRNFLNFAGRNTDCS